MTTKSVMRPPGLNDSTCDPVRIAIGRTFALDLRSVARDEGAEVRRRIFSHLAGIALLPTLHALGTAGILTRFEAETGTMSLAEMAAETGAREGYLRVGLRALACAGWLAEHGPADAPLYSSTEEGRVAFRFQSLFSDVTKTYGSLRQLLSPVGPALDRPCPPSIAHHIQSTTRGWGLRAGRRERHQVVLDRLACYLDGVLVGPAMVALKRIGFFDTIGQAYSRASAEVTGAPGSLRQCLVDLLRDQGWIAGRGADVTLTSAGCRAARIASSYGVIVSYLPLFERLPELIFPKDRRSELPDGESLVDRALNVWGSGEAHRPYFDRCSSVVAQIFDRPLETQPLGICDMGCGDGSLLEHLHRTIVTGTRRGACLDRAPLWIIGADCSPVAQRISLSRLRAAGISNVHVIEGDVRSPTALAKRLQELGIAPDSVLHIRSFLDHNRAFSAPEGYVPGTRQPRSTGAFAHRGEAVAPDVLEEDLVRHFFAWVPYVRRFGLLAIELHTLRPASVCHDPHRTASLAYDIVHGFSDQYPIEHDAFIACAAEAGLQADPRFSTQIPDPSLPVISLSLLQ